MSDFKYVGSELDLFANVTNWKSYWAAQIRPYLHGDVLEVGAGIGANTEFVRPSEAGRSVCVEPDREMALQLEQKLRTLSSNRTHAAICGTTATVSGQFDTVVYIDVLEHIEDDRGEMQRAAALLKPGGHLIVLSPAHQALFTPFDASIGHFRRYNKRMLREITPGELKVERLWYLDAAGLTASLGNRLFLQQSMPTPAQLELWDTWMIRLSRIVDPLTFYALGKTVVGVWSRQNRSAAASSPQQP
jgi:SAM-dependent methyltransferase